MTEILTKNEIDALLFAVNANETEPKDFKPASASKTFKIYDFKRPYKFTGEQIRAVSIVHETFARLTTNSLSAQLRSMVFVQVVEVDQLTYEEFIRSIPTPTTLAVINMDPLKGNVIMEINPAITFSIIDRICGGTGEEAKHQHELTDIEQSVMEDIIVRFLGNLREAWKPVLDLRPSLKQLYTNPQFAQIVPVTEKAVLVVLKTKVDDVEGIINICIPYLTIEPVIGKLSVGFGNENIKYYRSFSSSANLELTDRDYVPVRLTAEVLRRDYPLKEILKWDAETLAAYSCRLRILLPKAWGQACMAVSNTAGLQVVPKKNHYCQICGRTFWNGGKRYEVGKS